MDIALIIKFILGVAIGGAVGAYVGKNQVYNRLYLRNLTGDEDEVSKPLGKGERFKGSVIGLAILAVGIIGIYNIGLIISKGAADEILNLVLSIGVAVGCSVLGILCLIRYNKKA